MFRAMGHDRVAVLDGVSPVAYRKQSCIGKILRGFHWQFCCEVKKGFSPDFQVVLEGLDSPNCVVLTRVRNAAKDWIRT